MVSLREFIDSYAATASTHVRSGAGPSSPAVVVEANFVLGPAPDVQVAIDSEYRALLGR
jgi:hypothetical protein